MIARLAWTNVVGVVALTALIVLAGSFLEL
jgi:hypothetical protein